MHITMTTDAAPRAVHALLDAIYPLLLHGRRIGMGAQLVLTIDVHGNLGRPKVTLTGDGKKE